MRISNSFSEGEVQIMEFILQTLLRGGTPNMAARHKDFASLYRKVMSMKTRIEAKKAKVSSVGTIGAPDDDAEIGIDEDGDGDDQQQAV
ncbi:MAG: hypothetical protein DRJ42_19670 [Deltaproteobacteria bacterium]|nr:MAG: hypothetical protein DRJ42_19670 [Deltaproteobacteria bacterium]